MRGEKKEKIYMSNIQKERGIIDSNKQMFIKQFDNELTKTYYSRLFESDLFEFEQKVGKDVLDFTVNELMDFIKELNTTSYNAEVSGRILSSYFNYCIANHIINIDNPLNDISQKELRKLGKQTSFFSEEDIDDIIGSLVNPQDSVIIRLLFEGFNGKEFSEITSLTKHDIDVLNNEIKGKKVTDKLMQLTGEAFKQKEYYKKNGTDLIENVDFKLNMVMNDYIIRNTITKTDVNDKQVDKSVVFRRIKMISEVLEIDGFTSTSIYKSGQLWYANKIMIENNKTKMDKDVYNRVMKRFGLNNYYAIREYLNDKNINELYNRKEI
jgi:site-specific recombinase XerD